MSVTSADFRYASFPLFIAVLTRMFIGVRLKAVRTWTILPMGDNIAEVF
ncbi:hypothetical protein ACFLX8_01640 [Chloroflexota bacterium]